MCPSNFYWRMGLITNAKNNEEYKCWHDYRSNVIMWLLQFFKIMQTTQFTIQNLRVKENTLWSISRVNEDTNNNHSEKASVRQGCAKRCRVGAPITYKNSGAKRQKHDDWTYDEEKEFRSQEIWFASQISCAPFSMLFSSSGHKDPPLWNPLQKKILKF